MANVKKALKNVANAGAKVGKKAGRTVDKSTGTILGSDGKSLFFLILSFTCIWLILDMFYGNKLIKQLVDSIFSDSGTGSDEKNFNSISGNEVDKNNSTVSGATNNKNFSYQTPEEKRKSELNKQSKNNSTGSSGNQSANFPIHN